MRDQLFILFIISMCFSCENKTPPIRQSSLDVKDAICGNEGFLDVLLQAIHAQILQNSIEFARSDLISLLKNEIEITYGGKSWIDDSKKNKQNIKSKKNLSSTPSNSQLFTANFILDINSGVPFDSNEEVLVKPSKSQNPNLYTYNSIMSIGGLSNDISDLKKKSSDPYYTWQFSCPRKQICKLLGKYFSVDELKIACLTSKSILLSQCKSQLCRKLKD